MDYHIKSYQNDINNKDLLNNSHLRSSEFCCSACKLKIEFAPSKDKILNDLVVSFPKDALAISNAISLFHNTANPPIINLIYKLKYGGFTKIGREYGIWLGELLLQNEMNNYDFIVPTPIHTIRKRERGYNQSDYIAQGISKILKLPVKYDLLKKIRYTASQTQLTSEERKTNLNDAFQFNKKYNLAGKKILLVDDVLTTGSTLNNCAITLLENAASMVDVATLVKA